MQEGRYSCTWVQHEASDGSKQLNGNQFIVPLPQFHDREQNQPPNFLNDHFVASISQLLEDWHGCVPMPAIPRHLSGRADRRHRRAVM